MICGKIILHYYIAFHAKLGGQILKKRIALSVLFALLIFPCVLLMFSCNKECPHTYMTQTVVEPTHEKQGRTVYYCLDCEYEYSTDYVAPLGHTLQHETHLPSCTEQGYTYNYCRCGYHYTSNFVPPKGHTLSITEVAASCNTEGYKIADCEICDLHYTFDAVAPLGHALKAETTYVATCKQNGSTTYVCERDGCEFSYIGDYIFYSDLFEGAYTSNTTALAKGVDTSKHNHNKDSEGNLLPLDWNGIKAAGFDFAILRLGYMGSGNIGQVDPAFEMDYAAAKEAGLDVGAYFYSYAYTVEDARAEAEFALTLLEGKTFEYPIYFDIEDESQMGLDRQLLTDICVEFCSILQEHGYYASIYTNNTWLSTLLQKDKLATLFDIWYARYDSLNYAINDDAWEESFGDQMVMWQFSATGQIEGLDLGTTNDYIDLNYVYKDYPTLIKSMGYNNFSLDKNSAELDK